MCHHQANLGHRSDASTPPPKVDVHDCNTSQVSRIITQDISVSSHVHKSYTNSLILLHHISVDK